MIRRKIKQSELDDNPHLLWNSFVDLIAIESYQDLSETQRLAHLIFWYDSEVQNGGHLQYFLNSAGSRAKETLTALHILGMKEQVEILNGSLIIVNEHPPQEIESVDDYIAEAAEKRFEELDQRYYDCSKSADEYLEEFLEKNLREFIELT